jgi:hypothetical protein
MGWLLAMIVLLVVVSTAKVACAFAAWWRSGGVPRW